MEPDLYQKPKNKNRDISKMMSHLLFFRLIYSMENSTEAEFLDVKVPVHNLESSQT
jgi:hypothetical protein